MMRFVLEVTKAIKVNAKERVCTIFRNLSKFSKMLRGGGGGGEGKEDTISEISGVNQILWARNGGKNSKGS